MALAAEEAKHALLLRSFALKTATSPLFIDERRFNTAAIQTFTIDIEKELARLNQERVLLIEALSITVSIEQSLIESKFLEVFKTDSAELKVILKKLLDDTIDHRNQARVELEKYRKNQLP